MQLTRKGILIGIATILLSLGISFGAGTWYGYEMPRSHIDPQDYVETLFTPYDDGQTRYLKLIDSAQESIYIASFAFANDAVTERLIELKKERPKLTIRVLTDSRQSGSSDPSKWNDQRKNIERARAAGIEVVIGKSESYGQIMHHKYTVVDGLWVFSGSWNLSDSADRQANELDFVKSRRRARLFLDNWHRMYRFMQPRQTQ